MVLLFDKIQGGLSNTFSLLENLVFTGQITGDINFTFPPNTIMPGGSYLVLAKVPADQC